MFVGARKDPRQVAPVGSYLENGTVMLEVLESDWAGVLGEDMLTGLLVKIESGPDLDQHWRRVRPQAAA